MAEYETTVKEKSGIAEFLGDMLDIIETGLGSIFVLFLLLTYLFLPVSVDGGSMQPTLYNGDTLLMLRKLWMPSNGSIVVIDDQEGLSFSEEGTTEENSGLNRIIVKRLIAQGGQEVNIDFDNGTVAVDGVQLQEPYIADLTKRDDSCGRVQYPIIVPEGYVFVMGDNRNHSTDSRNPNVGVIPEDLILGQAVLRTDRDEKLRTSWTEKFALLF
ncbi:MAG: signal peptidase I [Oscillospiraceae bacterium]|nr:signal peptidase I [Oscillospiraceae bacterium]